MNLRQEKAQHEVRLRKAALLQPWGRLLESRRLQQAGGCSLCSKLPGVGPLRALTRVRRSSMRHLQHEHLAAGP